MARPHRGPPHAGLRTDALERAIARVVHEPAVTAIHWSAHNLETVD